MSLKISYITSGDYKVAEAKLHLPTVEKLHLPDLFELQSRHPAKVIARKLRDAASRIPDLGNRIIIVDDVSLTFNNSFGFPGALVREMIDAGNESGPCGGALHLYRYGLGIGATRAKLSAHIGLLGGGIIVPQFFEGSIEGAFGPPCPNPVESPKEIDSILIPDGSSLYLGELPFARRSIMNHRAIALSKVREFLADEMGFVF